MTLPCKVILLFTILVIQEMTGQVKPPPLPPPPPPDFEWTPPSREERLNALAKRNCTADELMEPMSYYSRQDAVFPGVADSVRAKQKLRRAHFEFVGPAEEKPDMTYYSYYDKAGHVEQTAVTSAMMADSLVHKWKYDNLGNLKYYVTLTYGAVKGMKRKVNGDSVLFKYNATGDPIEITRYAITGSGASRSASFISKDTYTYDVNRAISGKLIDGYRFKYKYDNNKHIVRIECKAIYDGEIYTIDSFAWKSDAIRDTIEHWAVAEYDHMRILMERQIINRSTGLELEYGLFPESKFNFIRSLEGPIRVTYAYDAGNRLINMAHYTGDGMLMYEKSFTFTSEGIIQEFQTMILHDPEYDTRPLPPTATAFGGDLYVATGYTYLVKTSGALPGEIELRSTLIGINNIKREILARGTKTGKVNIVCEYYQ